LLREASASRLNLWGLFILAHLWLGYWNLYGPNLPLGDVTYVYKYWMQVAWDTQFWVGIDSQWVYPIAALLPMVLSSAFGADMYGSTWLSIVMLLNVAAFGVVTSWGRSRENMTVGWWWVGFLFLLGPIALGRIDSVTVPITLIGMVLIARRPRFATALLTIAMWMKVWPAALIAALVVALRSRAQIAVTALVTSAVIVGCALLLGSGGNVFSFFSQQAGRGLQVEAPISTPWLWLAATGGDAFVYYNRVILTYQVDGGGTAVAAAVMTPLMGLVAITVCVFGLIASRKGATATQLLAPLALALVLVFIVFNKVGSPQFQAWLAVPVIVGLIAARQGGVSFRLPAVMVLAVAGLTQVIYPTFYDSLLALEPWMLLTITLRNVLLIVLLAWGISLVIRLAFRPVEVLASPSTESAARPLEPQLS
jgi:hypothetical protein